MAKYDGRFKKKVVKVCQNDEGGDGTLAHRFSMSDFSMVRKWVKIVEKRGFEALQGRKTKQHSLSKLLVRSEGVYSGLFLSGNEIIHLNHLW